MKVAVIADTHFGARNDNRIIQEHQFKFFEKVFFPVIDKLNIKHLLHLGDLFDKRQSIDILTLKNVRENFLEPLRDRSVMMDVICGNHDTYYKTTNDVNTLEEVLNDYGVSVITQPQIRQLGKFGVLYIPWISTNNVENTMHVIKQSNAKYVFGHLELQGFEHHLGHMATKGLDKSIFKKFDGVWSGHYHQRSSQGNIEYLGAPYEMTWSDAGCLRGFGIFDTTSGVMTHIKNPLTLFEKISYSDENDDFECNKSFKDKFVRIKVLHKKDVAKFDRFRDDVEKQNPADLIIDDISLEINDIELNLDAENQDTISILKTEVDLLDIENKQKIHDIIIDLYVEASDMKV